jgi:acetyltransferase-like isoleucine patch superfamily enzyme
VNVAKALTQSGPSLRWRFGRIMTNAVYKRAFEAIGPGTVIVKPLVLRGVERITLGSDCAVYEGSWLAAEPEGRLTVGDGVYLGHHVHIHAVEDVTIGKGTMIADGALVNSGRHVTEDAMRVEGTGPINIGQGCFIGQRAVVLGGVTIGDGATIGAGAVVTRDIPAGTTAVGVPARVISRMHNQEP